MSQKQHRSSQISFHSITHSIVYFARNQLEHCTRSMSFVYWPEILIYSQKTFFLVHFWWTRWRTHQTNILCAFFLFNIQYIHTHKGTTIILIYELYTAAKMILFVGNILCYLLAVTVIMPTKHMVSKLLNKKRTAKK